MKSIFEASSDIEDFSNKLIQKLINAQKDTAKRIFEDVKSGAPVTTGDYLNSIQVSETTFKDGIIKTKVYTDLTSETDKNIFIGRMIENGNGIYALEPHIGKTKTFIESGYRYWYVPVTSVKRAIGQIINIGGKEFYVAYAQPAKPHWIPALNKNIGLRYDNIKKAIREAK